MASAPTTTKLSDPQLVELLGRKKGADRTEPGLTVPLSDGSRAAARELQAEAADRS